MIDISKLHIQNSPDVRDWPATATITKIEFVPGAGIHFEFDRQDTWPDVTPPGWRGPIQYTVWILLRIDGEWYGSGVIECWRGRASTDDDDVTANDQIARNWLYDDRWGDMRGHQPQPGEYVGFMLTAGDARGRDIHAVQERSRIVEISWPATSGGSILFRWVEGEGSSPGGTPASVSVDLSRVPAQLDAIRKRLDRIQEGMRAILRQSSGHEAK